MGAHLNVFRLLGDFAHVASFIVLLHRLWTRRNATGERARAGWSGGCFAAVQPIGTFHPRPPLRPSTGYAPAGISLKTQQLYLLVFVSRYTDLFTNHTSAYNTVMKVLYLAGETRPPWQSGRLRLRTRVVKKHSTITTTTTTTPRMAQLRAARCTC